MKSIHEGVTYECNICHLRVTQKSNLTFHINTVHFRKRRYSCKICDFESTKSHLLRHIENVHHNSEKIICTECNKSIRKMSLSAHMKIFHSGEQPQYSCSFCTFQTIHKHYLKKHVVKVHQKRN